MMVSDDPISVSDFVAFAHHKGPGKYMLGRRGKGIRGFRKITDCVVEEESEPEIEETPSGVRMFNAETISVRKNMKVGDMGSSELVDLMNSMSSQQIQNAEDFDRFQSDLATISDEIGRRGIGGTTGYAPAQVLLQGESPVVSSAGFAVGGKSAAVMGLAAGFLLGVLGTSWYYKNKIDDLHTRLESFENKLSEAESSIKRSEERESRKQNAEKAVAAYDSALNMDAEFLQRYNSNRGPVN